jgi:ribonuclease D
MTEDILPPPVWVDEQSAFQQLIAKLSAQSRIAVDTESNSLHAYRERVCLIQFSTPDTDFLVDPFSIRDMSPLAPVFANPAIEKIFHAAEYDLVCLRRDFGFKFTKLFDTMQAARILGYPFVGLDNILLEKFDIKIDKRHQKADWGARPLTPQQIDYALSVPIARPVGWATARKGALGACTGGLCHRRQCGHAQGKTH